MIVHNGNAYEEGLGDYWKPMKVTGLNLPRTHVRLHPSNAVSPFESEASNSSDKRSRQVHESRLDVAGR